MWQNAFLPDPAVKGFEEPFATLIIMAEKRH